MLQVHDKDKRGYKIVQVESGGEVELESRVGKMSHISSMVTISKRMHQDNKQKTCLYVRVRFWLFEVPDFSCSFFALT